ncbi:hypothetical protein LJR078_001750 [Arthrobacter sp. LjRoot78]
MDFTRYVTFLGIFLFSSLGIMISAGLILRHRAASRAKARARNSGE